VNQHYKTNQPISGIPTGIVDFEDFRDVDDCNWLENGQQHNTKCSKVTASSRLAADSRCSALLSSLQVTCCSDPASRTTRSADVPNKAEAPSRDCVTGAALDLGDSCPLLAANCGTGTRLGLLDSWWPLGEAGRESKLLRLAKCTEGCSRRPAQKQQSNPPFPCCGQAGRQYTGWRGSSSAGVGSDTALRCSIKHGQQSSGCHPTQPPTCQCCCCHRSNVPFQAPAS